MVYGLSLSWLVVLAVCWLGWQLLRQNGRLLLRIEDLEKRLDSLEFGEPGPPPGMPLDSLAPEFELPDLAGETRALAHFRGQSVLLVFFNPACGYCRELAPKLADLMPRSSRREEAQTQMLTDDQGLVTPAATDGRPRLLIISTGDMEQNRRFFAEHKLNCPVLLQKEMEVASAYQAAGTPSGYRISPEGRIVSELAMGGEALLALASGKTGNGKQKAEIDQGLPASSDTPENGQVTRFNNRSLTHSKIKRDGLKAGTRAPDFRLPRLDGAELHLEDLRGKQVLLVFSSPHCGPCNVLAPALEKFHRGHPEMEVVMVSKGEPKENRTKVKEHGLTFPVVLQQQWEISRRYSMFATPIAYLIDEAGMVRHDVAAGVEPILALMTRVNQQSGAKAEMTL